MSMNTPGTSGRILAHLRRERAEKVRRTIIAIREDGERVASELSELDSLLIMQSGTEPVYEDKIGVVDALASQARTHGQAITLILELMGEVLDG